MLPYGLYTARLFCPWDSPDKNTGVGCHDLLQIFLTQGLNLSFLSLLHRQTHSLTLVPHRKPSVGYIFPFLLYLLLLFFPQLFVKLPHIITMPYCIYLAGGGLVTTSCTMLPTSVHSSSDTLSTTSNVLNLFITSTVFDLGHISMAWYFPYFLQFKPELYSKKLMI